MKLDATIERAKCPCCDDEFISVQLEREDVGMNEDGSLDLQLTPMEASTLVFRLQSLL